MKLGVIWRRLLDAVAKELAAPIRSAVLSTPQHARTTPLADQRTAPILELPCEWEPSWGEAGDLSVTRLGQHQGIIGVLSISRTVDYSLSVSVRTHMEPVVVHDVHAGTEQGEVTQGIEIEANGVDGSIVLVPNAFVAATQRSWSMNLPELTDARILARTVTRTWPKRAGTEVFATDWYLSGPRSFNFPRATHRERIQRITRTRRLSSEDSDARVLTFPRDGARPSGSVTRDYL